MRKLLLVCLYAVLLVTALGCGDSSSNDSTKDQAPVSNSTENKIPIANAGIDQIVTLQSTPIPIDGHASRDDDGDIIKYQWQLISKPTGSNASLSNATNAVSYLSVDLVGNYEVALTVNDSIENSVVDTSLITVVQKAKNIILLIGDGMGFEEVRAAGIYENGEGGHLSFERLNFHGSVSTRSADNSITDSAAAATALATGSKVNNGVISETLPGDGSPLKTILERFTENGIASGLVTTATITHATPASFASHESSRNNQSEIAHDYLFDSRPDVLMGGAEFVNEASAANAGYTVVSDRAGLLGLDTVAQNKVWGQFGATYLPYEYDDLGNLPHLSEMTQIALEILDNDPDGFFLMVEGGRIDHAGHDNDLQRNIFETIEFSHASQKVLNWANGRNDTLVIITADHETGGLSVVKNNGAKNWPTVTWQTTDHTGVDVPIYAWGVNAHKMNAKIDNTDIYKVMLSTGL